MKRTQDILSIILVWLIGAIVICLAVGILVAVIKVLIRLVFGW